MTTDETRADQSRPTMARPPSGETPVESGRVLAPAAQGRTVMVRRIDLARVRLGGGARTLRDKAAPVAAGTAALVKRRSSDVALWLGRFHREKAASRAGGFARRLKLRLHPRSLIGDYRRLLLFLHDAFIGRRHERLFFVPTRGYARSVGLSIPSQVRVGAHDYRPTPYKVFAWAMAALSKAGTPEDMTFVDFGAGRGRVLLLASHHPFQKITGAEIARELHEDCRMNIAQYPRSLMKCRDVACEHLRASTFPTPEGPCVFYFFNPFDMAVFEKVVARITRSYKRTRRPMHLVCVNMDEAGTVEAQGIFHKVRPTLGQRAKIGLFSPYSIGIYKTQG